MKFCELAQGVACLSSTVAPETDITGIAYDSRKVQPGNIFVAITGFQADGHRFIPAALERGAVAVICERVPEQDIPYYQVASCRKALAELSANWFDHPADKMTMIGITGTNGKTSSTVILKQILEKTIGAKVGLIGTIQNMIGDCIIETERTTPESYEHQKLFDRMYREGCSTVIMEVSSHALCLERVAGIRFQVGAFTNLTEDHLDFHGTMEAYRDAKRMLFRQCEVGDVNIDDPAGVLYLQDSRCRMITTSARNQTADLYATDVQLHSDSVEMTACSEEGRYSVRIGIPGTFTAYNTMTVLGCCAALGIPMTAAVAALSEVSGVQGRIEVVPTPGKDYTVLIDYAHTPDALENILKSVRDFCKGRLIAVFGCGGDRDPIKRPIMGKIGVDMADLVIFTSDNPRTEDPLAIIDDVVKGAAGSTTPYIIEEDRRKAIRTAMDIARKNDIIVLAGKGHETYQERGREKFHLDEREEVAAHLIETA